MPLIPIKENNFKKHRIKKGRKTLWQDPVEEALEAAAVAVLAAAEASEEALAAVDAASAEAEEVLADIITIITDRIITAGSSDRVTIMAVDVLADFSE